MKDGGSAFPQLKNSPFGGTFGGGDPAAGGMSLRDWFAGQALIGEIIDAGTNPGAIRALAKEKGITTSALIAMLAFAAADAMLAERERALPSEAPPMGP